MSKIFELYGYRLDSWNKEAADNRAKAWCPFMDAECDGGGNRYLSALDLRNVRIRLHRPINGRIKTATVKREGTEWYVIFTAEVEAQPLPTTGSEVGIDLGLQHLIVTSDGEFVDAPRFYRAAQKKLRRAQRSLSRKLLNFSDHANS